MRINKSPPRLTAYARAALRLGVSYYEIVRLVSHGVLETEDVDGHPKIVIASLEGYERELEKLDKADEQSAA
jgi:hypothetical protein